MRVPLPVRIFLVQLLFLAGVGILAVFLTRGIFDQYQEEWDTARKTLLEQREYTPILDELGRALLVYVESTVPERREQVREDVSLAIDAVLDSMVSVESIVVVNRDRIIQFANDPAEIDQSFVGSDDTTWFASNEPVTRVLDEKTGLTEVIRPIFDAGADRTKLGWLKVRYLPDRGFRQRLENVRFPEVDAQDYLKPLLTILGVGLAVGVIMAILTGLPVRRLEKAVAEFRARDFRGGFHPEKAGKELAPAVKAISELGGRLEALDAQRREREALLATLSQSLEEGMIALDPAGAPVAWNPAALRIFGAPSVKEDRSPEETSSLEAWQIEEGLKVNPALVTRRDGETVVGSQEVDLVRHGGERSPARVTRVPFEMRPGEEGTLLLLGDLATLRKVQTHLLEAGRFAVLAHLAAGLAHEIRNPLHSIRINASVVEQYLSAPQMDSDAVNQSLSTIKNETHRLADLLNNYLGMVRPEKETALVDLRDLCRRVIQLVEYSARKSQIRIRLEGEEDPPLVRGVPDRLQQAILNLVLNAIQAMPGGGALSLSATQTEGHVRVTVSDTGPGIPAEVASELFEAGVTTKPGGSGLGLSLVRLIAESHGGSVTYRSTPGQGTSFALDLPAENGG